MANRVTVSSRGKSVTLGDPPDATNPADNFDPDLNLRKVIALNAKVARLKERHESAKSSLKETDEYSEAKTLSEELKGATAELDQLLSELGREYPLFDRNGHA